MIDTVAFGVRVLLKTPVMEGNAVMLIVEGCKGNHLIFVDHLCFQHRAIPTSQTVNIAGA